MTTTTVAQRKDLLAAVWYTVSKIVEEEEGEPHTPQHRKASLLRAPSRS